MIDGRKRFINQTDKDLNIVIFIREGSNPEDEGGRKSLSVAAQGTVEVIYTGEPGEEDIVFLNGLLIEWMEGTELIGVSRRVVSRGDTWDNVLNTNEVVVIAALSAGIFEAHASRAG